MSKWPKREAIEDIMKTLNDENSWSHGPGMAVSQVDCIKYDISSEFIIYKREKNLNQRELAQKLEIGEALVSKILRHKLEDFTIDRLVRYLEKIGIKYEFKKVA
jgi:predicted XRE-type DNA-binding protein